MKLDLIDLGIIKALLDNARKPKSHIAKELKIPVTTVHFRLKKMEETGLIKGYEMYTNPSSLYEKMKILFIQVKAIPSRKNEVHDFIKNSKYFNKSNTFKFSPYVWLSTGNFNLEVYAHASTAIDISMIKQLLTRHPAILDITISIAKKEVWSFKRVFVDHLSKMVKING